MRKSNGWANHLLSVDPDDAILLNMFPEDNVFGGLLPMDMLLCVNKMKAGYACEVFRHWVTTGEWVWSDKANHEYVRPTLRFTR